MLMGTLHSRDITNGGDDTALIRGSSSGSIWTGIIGAPVKTPISSYATNPTGFTVLNEGSYSGEVSSIIQNNSVGCVWVSGYAGLTGQRYECNLVWAHSSGIGNQEGDSGGPMVRYVSGQLDVVGIVSLGASPTPCSFNVTKCFHDVYYTAMNEILQTEYPGSTLVNG